MMHAAWNDSAMGAQRVEAWDNKRLVRCFAERPTSFIALLENAKNKHPDKKALVFEQQRWSYQDTWHEVLRCAQALSGLGIAPQDRVLLFVSNRPEFVFVLFAIQYLGAIAVPVGIREQKPGLTYIMNQCKAKAIVFDEALHDRIPAFSEVASLAHRIALDMPQHGNDMVSLSALCASHAHTSITPATTQEFDTSVILYTSGTTGNPKGAMLTHTNIAHSVLHYEYGMALTHEDTSALAVPASHVTGLIAIIAAMVHVAGAVIILREFKAATFLAAAVEEQMTYTLMVPAMYNLCLREPAFARMALQRAHLHWIDIELQIAWCDERISQHVRADARATQAAQLLGWSNEQAAALPDTLHAAAASLPWANTKRCCASSSAAASATFCTTKSRRSKTAGKSSKKSCPKPVSPWPTVKCPNAIWSG